MRPRRFGAATRNESDPQGRITCRHLPAARRAARPPVPSRKGVRHGPDVRRGGPVVPDIVGSMRLRSRRQSCTGECQMAIMETKPPLPRAILVGIQLPSVDDVAYAASIKELGRLVKTLGYEVVGTLSQKRDEIDGGTVLGKGRLEELAAITGGTGVIMEIFHRHAHSREAKLQVEIARLKYVAPRLRESLAGGGGRQQGSGAG